MFDVPITWDAIVGQITAFGSIPVVAAVVTAVVGISLVVFVGEQLIGLFTAINKG